MRLPDHVCNTHPNRGQKRCLASPRTSTRSTLRNPSDRSSRAQTHGCWRYWPSCFAATMCAASTTGDVVGLSGVHDEFHSRSIGWQRAPKARHVSFGDAHFDSILLARVRKRFSQMPTAARHALPFRVIGQLLPSSATNGDIATTAWLWPSSQHVRTTLTPACLACAYGTNIGALMSSVPVALVIAT